MTQVDTPLMWKINKIVAIRCHILRLKCTKFNFGWGGAYSAPPDLLAEFKGPTSKEGEGEGQGWGRKGRARYGRRPGLPLHIISGYATADRRAATAKDRAYAFRSAGKKNILERAQRDDLKVGCVPKVW